MKRKNMQDERVSSQRRKIYSEAYGILMMVLSASVLVQQFIFNAPFEQYAVEGICFFGISVYVLIRYMTLGLDIFGEGKSARTIPLLTSLTVGVTVTAVNGVLNYIRYADHYKEDGIFLFIAVLIITFISATVFSFVLLSFLNYLNKKKQAKIQKQLDADEKSE